MLTDARRTTRVDDHKPAHGFTNVVAIGYDDGPSTGAVQRTDGSAAFRFDLVATDVDGAHDRDAWDRGEELRVFALSPLPHGAFERIVMLLSSAEPPTWPVWVPGVRHRSPSIDRIIRDQVEPILQGAGSPRLAIATRGLLVAPVASRDLSDLNGEYPRDWFLYLGLEPEAVSI